VSDFPEGPDWVKGPDGLWRAPGLPAEPEPTEPKKRMSLGTFLAVVFAVLVTMAFLLGSNEDGSQPDAEELRFGAQDVCHQFVEDRLRAPATAKFEAYREATITNTGSQYTVRGHVDAENGFGALIRSHYSCVVRHTTDQSFDLVSLTGLDL
jgi:hypothetical protein